MSNGSFLVTLKTSRQCHTLLSLVLLASFPQQPTEITKKIALPLPAPLRLHLLPRPHLNLPPRSLTSRRKLPPLHPSSLVHPLLLLKHKTPESKPNPFIISPSLNLRNRRLLFRPPRQQNKLNRPGSLLLRPNRLGCLLLKPRKSRIGLALRHLVPPPSAHGLIPPRPTIIVRPSLFHCLALIFHPENGIVGACGSVATDEEHVVALSFEFYDSAAYCGRTITIKHGNKVITAKVQDKCESCVGTKHIDLSIGKAPFGL